MSTLLHALAEARVLKALSVWQPWAWCITEADKDRENRSWEPPQWLIGQVLAIHASKTYDENAAEWIRREFRLPVPLRQDVPLGAIVGIAIVKGMERGSASRWAASGQVQWCLGERVALPQAAPCKGAQGLWNVPPEVLSLIRTQLIRPRT